MDVISAILDIDNRANDMIEEGKRRRDEILKEAELAEKNIADDINSAADEKIEKFREEKLSEQRSAQEQLDVSLKESKERLQRVYDENHEKWENDIFSAVIGR